MNVRGVMVLSQPRCEDEGVYGPLVARVIASLLASYVVRSLSGPANAALVRTG